MKSVKLLLTVWFLSFANVAFAAANFWEKSKELKSDLFERHRVVVSVIDVGDHTEFKGAGLVKASPEKTWSFATNPEKIKKFAAALDDFNWNVQSGEANAAFHVLWKHFKIHAKTELRKKDEPPRIKFEFLEGSWMRVKGQLEIANQCEKAETCKTTLVIFRAETPEKETVGWHFALEAVLQQIAGSLRDAVEQDI